MPPHVGAHPRRGRVSVRAPSTSPTQTQVTGICPKGTAPISDSPAHLSCPCPCPISDSSHRSHLSALGRYRQGFHMLGAECLFPAVLVAPWPQASQMLAQATKTRGLTGFPQHPRRRALCLSLDPDEGDAREVKPHAQVHTASSRTPTHVPVSSVCTLASSRPGAQCVPGPVLCPTEMTSR